MNPELQAALDELTEVTRSATEENARRLDRLEADINLKALDPSGRLGGLSGFPDSGGRQAFNKFLRNGREALEPHEAKNLVLSDDTRGGYLAPPEFAAPVRNWIGIGARSAGAGHGDLRRDARTPHHNRPHSVIA